MGPNKWLTWWMAFASISSATKPQGNGHLARRRNTSRNWKVGRIAFRPPKTGRGGGFLNHPNSKIKKLTSDYANRISQKSSRKAQRARSRRGKSESLSSRGSELLQQTYRAQFQRFRLLHGRVDGSGWNVWNKTPLCPSLSSLSLSRHAQFLFFFVFSIILIIYFYLYFIH